MSRDRAVVDDPPALGVLPAHPGEGRPGAQEGAVQVDRDHRVPVIDGQLVDGLGSDIDAGIVKQHVEPPIQ